MFLFNKNDFDCIFQEPNKHFIIPLKSHSIFRIPPKTRFNFLQTKNSFYETRYAKTHKIQSLLQNSRHSAVRNLSSLSINPQKSQQIKEKKFAQKFL